MDDWFRGGFRPGQRFGKRFRLSTTPNLARPGVTEFTLAPGEDAGEILITVTDLPDTWGDLTVAGDGLGALGVLEWGNDVDGWQTLVDPAALGPVLVVASPALWGLISTIRVRGVSSAGRAGTSDEKSVFVPVQGEETIPEGSFFVSPAGNDSTGDGSETLPWRTLSYAATQVNASDTITVEDGVYTDTNQVTLPSGVEGAHTTVRARNKWGAIFTHGNYATFRTGSRHHITIDGLYFLLSTGGGGVVVEDGHHITVKNCKHRGGTYHFFASRGGDFFTVTDNDVSGIRFDSWWSAISFYQLQNVTGVSTTGFRNVIARNTIYDCYTTGAPVTDGNGIIIDDSHNEQEGGGPVAYPYQTLIDGNLVVNCGGKGIQVVYSDHATVRGNTCAFNGNPGQANDGTWWAEISLSLASDCVVVNNIAITDPTRHDGWQRPWADTGLGSWPNTGNIWKNNCGWDGTGSGVHVNEDGTGPLIGDNPLDGTDPEVVSATASAATANYQLRSASPCLDAGTAAYGLPTIDITGAPRVADSAVDIGAYEGAAAYALVEQWITSAGLAAGQATWTGTVAGTVLTETGAITTTTSGGTNSVLVFPGTSGNYMSKTDGIGPLPSGNDPSTTVLVAAFDSPGRWCGFSWGEPVNFKARTLGVQGTGDDTGEISADYYNAYEAGDDVVIGKGLGIYFQTVSALGVVRVYHGDQLVLEDLDRSLNTGTDRINLMRPYGSGTPAGGQIGCIQVYDGVLDATKRQEIVDTLNPLYLGMSSAPTATGLAFIANSPTTGVVSATFPTWRSVATGVISTSATKPSVDQIRLGLDHLGNPASTWTLGPALTADAEVEVGPIGLTPNATNYPHYFMEDPYGNVSTVQTGADDDTPPVTIPTAITPTTLAFPETVLSPFVLTTLTADQPVTTWSKVSGNAAFTVSTTGIVTLISDLADGSYSFVARATNSEGNFDATISVTVTDAAATADLAVRFGALTVTGEGGAQARDSDGDVVNFTSITSQPASRWAITSGRLVYTGTGGMVSEQITAVVDGATVAVNITVVPNMVSVKDSTEFAAISMTPAGTGDFTIHLRAGTTITKAAAKSKISGTSGSRRTLGGTLTLTGELVRGVPNAQFTGLDLEYFTGGAINVTNLKIAPTDAAEYSFASMALASNSANSIVQADNAPTTDVVFDGCLGIVNPDIASNWPGKTAAGGTNDWGHDVWGTLVKVNAVSGTSRPYVDGQVAAGPDILTFSGSGVKRVLMGIHSLGGGAYELQLSDASGNPDSIVPTSAVSGQGAAKNILVGDTVSGLDGFAATVVTPPTGVDTAGGHYSGAAAYTYHRLAPSWFQSPAHTMGTGYANCVRNLTIRNCDVSGGGGDGMIRPAVVDTLIVEQNKFHHFQHDCLKIAGNSGANFRAIIRRNDFYSSMGAGTDLGSVHVDYIQIFSPDGGGAYWDGFQMYHNRFLCNARGHGQGMFNQSGGNKLINGDIFGNIFVFENGGQGIGQNIAQNSQFFNNTYIINQKTAGLPANWGPGNGATMQVNAASVSPATGLYSGWNVARRYAVNTHLKTEKNFGLNGNTSKTQLEMVQGLAATKPTRPLYFETFDEVMTGAATILSGADADAGAVNSTTDWSGYPYYVTTDFSHISHANFVAPTYDPGVPSTLALGAVTGTGGTDVFSATATVVTPGGAVYWVVYPSSTNEPDAVQIQAGLNGDNTAATDDGTLGASTAGVKSIPSTAIAPGTYKISFVQVSGATVSPVVTATGTMTVIAAGITGQTQVFTYSDTAANTTLRESASVTPVAGQPLFIACGILNATSNTREIATVATWGTPGRGAGTGTVLTPVAHGYDSRATIKVFRVNNPAASLSTFQIAFNDGVNADTCGGMEVYAFQVAGGNTTEAVGVVANGADDPTTGSVITPSITTGTNGSYVLYCGMGPSGAAGAPTITTTNAAELYNHSSGNATGEQDETFAVAWEAAATVGTYDCTFTRSTSGTRRGLALEILAN